MKQQLDIVLPSAKAEAITAALQTIRQNLPFLIGMSPLDKRRLFKLGIKAQTFVEQALDMAESHPDLVPQRLDVEAARRSLNLFTTLNPILQTLNELQELVECTQMLAGSQAYAAARLAYRSVKTIGEDIGLNSTMDDLSRQFRSSRRPSNDAEVDEEPLPESP